MTIDTLCNIVVSQCFITTEGFMDDLPGKPFNLCIVNLNAKLMSY